MTSKEQRAKRNYTNQLRAQLKFYKADLIEERKLLNYAKRICNRYPKLQGCSRGYSIRRRRAGVYKTLSDIYNLKKRIKRLQREGKIYKII